MEKINLAGSKRTTLGRAVKKLRKAGTLPANLFGKKVKSISLQVPQKEFSTVFAKAGETGLVELSWDHEKRPVLIHNVQYHPVTSSPLHVDFYQVDLKEKVTAKVPIDIIGDAPAVKDKLGVLLNILSEVEVEALPADLVDKIEVDVSKLAAVDEAVKVSSLKVSDKIKILTDGNLDIVKIAPLVSKEAEQLAAQEAAAATAAAAEAAPAPAAEAEAEPAKPGEQATPSPTPTTEKPTGEQKAKS